MRRAVVRPIHLYQRYRCEGRGQAGRACRRKSGGERTVMGEWKAQNQHPSSAGVQAGVRGNDVGLLLNPGEDIECGNTYDHYRQKTTHESGGSDPNFASKLRNRRLYLCL